MYFNYLGQYILLLKASFRKPENFKVYWSEIMREMVSIGIGSLGIVCIISVFIGAVSTVQTAFQLTSGLIPRSIIGSITRDSVILEFSPTITSLVLAGRVGSSIASQIGTMRVTEQIDALEIMGVNAPGYLILPKVIGGVTMFPLLIILSVCLSLTGGYIAGSLSGAVTPNDYVIGLTSDFNPLFAEIALVKSLVFAFIITSVSAYQGYFTSGGALEVGQSSTRAVVTSCIIILCADYLIAQLLL